MREAMMIKGLRLATIWSEDLNRLLPFYRDVVGLTVSIETPAFVVFGDPNAPGLALGTHSEVRGKAGDPLRHMVALEVDDCVSESARLKEAGVEFIEEPNKTPNGITISTFKDPEGNLVQFMQFDQRF
jgi:predicted enzyme related to lactoylglutathione lyase